MQHTIIVGTGLVNEVLSPQQRYLASTSSAGPHEINRLMGRGRKYGEGPLPTFLRAARDAANEGAPIDLLFLAGDSEGDAVVEPLEAVAQAAAVIPAPSSTIPWTELVTAIDRFGGGENGADLRFLIVGCHTEQRVLALASFLRNALGYDDVAVSSHLVGSATLEAHYATLRYNLPTAGVRVLLDLEEAAAYAGLKPAEFAALECTPCRIEPAEARDALGEAPQRIVELLCMHWTRAELRPLAGGFSGSLLFLANGWKGEARTEPMVIKIDDFAQMRRELDGYHQVKDFFGKHVPTFGYPVTQEALLGVGMELAAMEGAPQTLQDTFEEAESEQALSKFTLQFDKALSLLSDRLYRNTGELAWVAPYRTLGLHAEQQRTWFQENGRFALDYLDPDTVEQQHVDLEHLAQMLRLISSNPDAMETQVCVGHGDLNYANVICDVGDNIWFIDWTHCGQAPVELDFAKLENDVKFVMSKLFDESDIPRLRAFEEWLVDHRIPPDIDELPDSLKFVKWDLRFRKILSTLRSIRHACFGLKDDDDWVVYRIALLRYALHTLSFDKRRGKGECHPVQLVHALFSAQALIYDLVADDFHLKIRAERPPSYPERQRISIDESPWPLDCPSYDPPYHVADAVLRASRLDMTDGWADPEDVSLVADASNVLAAKRGDDSGRPLNPRGRTGIAGRGLLGLWGRNMAAAAVVTRGTGTTVELLLGSYEDRAELELTKAFVLSEEKTPDAVLRALDVAAGWRPSVEGEVVFEGYTYDIRQTDHAWVESKAFLFALGSDAPDRFQAGGLFEEVKWYPLSADTVNQVPSGQARFIREAIERLRDAGTLDDEQAAALLARTG